jgi:hypothetical protein
LSSVFIYKEGDERQRERERERRMI